MGKKVLSLGQCAFDHGALGRFFLRHFQAELIPADKPDEALDLFSSGFFDLVLVNRILDRDQSSGLDFIKVFLLKRLGKTPVMLISNLPEAQAQAMGLGAVPGFGKAELESPAAIRLAGNILAGHAPG
ncbi:MAG: hypothetical protein EXR99_04300 [Gemmataceae bacterium]|nr:hypothetical protein [Gemmataceae bacterium]